MNEGRRRDSSEMGRALFILRDRAKYYEYKGRMQIHVFSKSSEELRILEAAFGGNHYRHGSGFVWIISKRKTIQTILDRLETKEGRKEPPSPPATAPLATEPACPTANSLTANVEQRRHRPSEERLQSDP